MKQCVIMPAHIAADCESPGIHEEYQGFYVGLETKPGTALEMTLEQPPQSGRFHFL